ncbi:MAG: zinc-dependent peptidase [Opitutaceae bacterium]
MTRHTSISDHVAIRSVNIRVHPWLKQLFTHNSPMTIWEQLKDFFIKTPTIDIEFKDEWVTYLESNLPLYALLPQELRLRIHEKIRQFVATTFFEGCNGLDLTDEMILTVAGQACILIINREGRPYPNLNTVLLYPSTFSSRADEEQGGQISHRLGESWSNGTVILAWDSVEHGARNVYDGHNVTLHEFAHQLDSELGGTDGTPLHHDKAAYHTWGRVIHDGYTQLVEDAEQGRKTVLDHYGATNPAEYFAVATEAFFEKPKQMLKKRPELYDMLKGYYRLDPVEWFTE